MARQIGELRAWPRPVPSTRIDTLAHSSISRSGLNRTSLEDAGRAVWNTGRRLSLVFVGGGTLSTNPHGKAQT